MLSGCPPDWPHDEGYAPREQDHPSCQQPSPVIHRIAKAWEHMAGLLGYRLRPELGVNFQVVASLVSAAMRGLALMSPSTPDIVNQRIQANPFGAGTAEWSTPALGLASIALTFLEPDPTFESGAHRAQ
jgi:hypothetical protein